MELFSLLVIGFVILVGGVLVYKALRKCCRCECSDYDTENATGAIPLPCPVPRHEPSDTGVKTTTTRTTHTTTTRTTYIRRIAPFPPSGTATTSTGPTVITVPSKYPVKASTSVTPECTCSSVITGIVTYVGDGDGFRLFHSCPGHNTLDDTLSIRLAGIDAPEVGKKQTQGQPYAIESKNYLFKLIRRKTLFLEKLGVDQYGRILAMAYLPDPQNANRTTLTADNNVNLEMVKRGLACVYIGRDAEYGKYEQDFLKAEAEAKILKKGMWAAEGNVVTPMEYKKQQRASHPVYVV